MMTKRNMNACLGVFTGLLLVAASEQRPSAQDDRSNLKVNVVLVQLNVAVTDHAGNYVSGLRPQDFAISEDKIPEKIATFEEGNQIVRDATAPDPSGNRPAAAKTTDDANSASSDLAKLGGSSVFILFDTSNYMYRGFVFAQDAIADFVRSLDDSTRVAFYSYSRNLSRAATLTEDRFRIENGVRSTVAGDDAALYNSLLMTVEDAAELKGRKAIVVFSNGPDNASSVPPEDVADLAESTGTIIYIISTRQAQSDPISAAAFARMSRTTGGKAYFAGNWRQEQEAFTSIREDLSHLYTISYYPQANPNHGWRNIQVRLTGEGMQKYHIRTRDGYRLLQPTSPAPEPAATSQASSSGMQ
ncbi:MAG TPA: VWA domain-containing protein [Terracidiphilus sp.]|nr:VWA domain-containing protein [Terracidiphilus sp.]